MNNEVTLENIGKLFDIKLDARFSAFEKKINEKFEGLTQIMIDNFDRVFVRLNNVEERLEKVEI